MVSPDFGLRLCLWTPAGITVTLEPDGAGGGGEPANRKSICSVIEKVARPGNGELGRAEEAEANRLALPGGPNAEPPRLHIDTTIPEAGRGRGNGHVHRSCYIEVDKLIARRRERHIDFDPIHLDSKCGRPHLCRDWNRINAGCGDAKAKKPQVRPEKTQAWS
jgi:hypothetical protein